MYYAFPNMEAQNQVSAKDCHSCLIPNVTKADSRSNFAVMNNYYL